MDANDLVPPSHFAPDSLGSSPKDQQKDSTTLAGSSVTIFPTLNPAVVLKTPDDFAMPKHKQPIVTTPKFSTKESSFDKTSSTRACYKLGNSFAPNFHGNVDYHPRVCESVGSPSYQCTSKEDKTAVLLKEMKEENKKLRETLINHKADNSSKSSMDVITHQVQYIERLQQDLSGLSNKLKCKEDQLSKQQSLTYEKNLQLQQQAIELDKLKADLNKEKEDKLKQCDISTELKENLISAHDEQDKLRKIHEADILEFTRRHKDELESLRENHRKACEEMEKRLESERRTSQDMKSEALKEWELKCHNLSEEYKSSLKTKMEAVEEEMSRMQEHQESLQSHLVQAQETEQELRNEIDNLSHQLKNNEESTEILQNNIQTLKENLESEKATIVNLRAYISQVQSDEHAIAQWKMEKEKLHDTLEKHKEENDDLKKTIETLNVRFQSVSRILEMQEEAIAVHTNAMPDPQNQNKAAVVISQWRMKVFELMVQCKSQDILLMEQTARHKIAVKDLGTRLQDQTRETEILSNRLKDSDAQLELKSHVNQTLESQNEKLTRNLQEWKNKVQNQDAAALKLRENVSAMNKTVISMHESNLSTCMEKCLRLEQRLAFANNRIRTVGDLLKRRDAIRRARLQQCGRTNADPSDEKQQQNSDLRMELLHLTEERDSLSQQLANDAAQFERTIKGMKTEKESCKRAVQELKKQLLDYEEKMKDLTDELQSVKASLDNEEYEKKCALEDIKEMNKKTSQEVEKAVEEEKQTRYEMLQEKEASLTQVKRELTKSVVALRQSERASVRERNRLTEQLEQEREAWTKEEEKLRNEIRNFQKDNNLLMTTLRQEGLVSAFKAARGQPVPLNDDAPPKRVHFSPQQKVPEGNKVADVDKMLQDLTNLSEKVLAGSESD